MQNHYNLLYREEEREMMPVLKVLHFVSLLDPSGSINIHTIYVYQYFGVGCTPWSPLARGILTHPLDEATERGARDR